MCFVLDRCAQSEKGETEATEHVEMGSWCCPRASRLSEGLVWIEPLSCSLRSLFFFFLKECLYFYYLFTYLFIFGCVVSSFLCEGFL